MPKKKVVVKKTPEQTRTNSSIAGDITVDILGILTSFILAAWSLNILLLEDYKTFTNKELVYFIISTMSINVVCNFYIIVREIVVKKYKNSAWKWPLLFHTILVIIATIWSKRSLSTDSEKWCEQTYKPIFGLVLSSSSIYVLAMTIYGPGMIQVYDYINKK